MKLDEAKDLAQRKAKDWNIEYSVWSSRNGEYTVAQSGRIPHDAESLYFIAYPDGTTREVR